MADYELKSTQTIKFNKTETEYTMKSIRFLLLTITTMFIVIAALMIVLGISVYTHYHSVSYFFESARSGRFITPSVLCVFLGMVLMIVTSIGFFGSLKQSTCMVNLYAVTLLVILFAKLILVIMAFTTNASKITKYINIPVELYAEDPEIEVEVDRLQAALYCCGSKDLLDYEGLEFTSNHSTFEFYGRMGFEDPVSVEIPQTCCSMHTGNICLRVWNSGCKDAIVNAIVQNASVLGVLGVSVMFIQLLGVIFAFLLARCIRKLKSEKTLLAWKIMLQMIIARKLNIVQNSSVIPDDKSVYIDPRESSLA